MSDDGIVEGMRLALVNVPIADGITFQSIMIQISQMVNVPWDEPAFRRQTAVMARASLDAYRQISEGR